MENLEYLRGTGNHFMAATASIQTLFKFGVLKELKPKARDCLVASNMNMSKLYELGRCIADVCGIPREATFRTQNGVQAFDFSAKGWCVETMRFLDSNSLDSNGNPIQAMVQPIGDSLVNPFWPQGLGVNRGFHGALDAVFAMDMFLDGYGREEVERARSEAYQYFINIGFGQLFAFLEAKSWTADPASRYAELKKDRRLAGLAPRKPISGAE